MKPRDLLLGRHKTAQPKLDEVRRATLGSVTGSEARDREDGSASWRTLLNPLRWHLVGISAAWLLVALLNSGSTVQPAPITAQADNNLAQQDPLMVVRENRQQFLQLLETASREHVTPVPLQRRRGSVASTNNAV
jgi:hypothetical protein